ncbi:hypothetical protein ACQ4LE_006828 [Meloidogyne hapla]|uniref:G-patch domain-containing protein n=1 Tax=Meloidogyne hapla TaxID=6305 RepID=A0A1I8BY35_MELHA
MSLLAEPRRKQRISIDPQNLNWANDEKRFGKKLMKQMGWKGGGLGPEGVGMKDCVKTKSKNDQRGLGASDDNYVPHLDEYAKILADLNKAKKNKVNTTENTCEKIKRKDEEKSENKSKSDCEEENITKTKSKTRKEKSRKRKVEDNDKFNQQVNSLTMDQYFAQKMAKLKRKT